ncbi:MAG: hypothetical protein IKV27_03580 [Lachnospiraceae bacterium]|nr:hypothetical protein [Lachnospiraceae bacterium]
MQNKKKNTLPDGQQPTNVYDDGDIPQVDLPQDIIPDEVPRKDGPGGESSQNNKQ